MKLALLGVGLLATQTAAQCSQSTFPECADYPPGVACSPNQSCGSEPSLPMTCYQLLKDGKAACDGNASCVYYAADAKFPGSSEYCSVSPTIMSTCAQATNDACTANPQCSLVESCAAAPTSCQQLDPAVCSASNLGCTQTPSCDIDQAVSQECAQAASQGACTGVCRWYVNRCDCSQHYDLP
jgi:hypothetical protein